MFLHFTWFIINLDSHWSQLRRRTIVPWTRYKQCCRRHRGPHFPRGPGLCDVWYGNEVVEGRVLDNKYRSVSNGVFQQSLRFQASRYRSVPVVIWIQACFEVRPFDADKICMKYNKPTLINYDIEFT